MFPLFTTRCLHVRHEVRDPSGGSGNCGRECYPVILPKWLPRHLGIFYMPQIYDMGPTALLPLRRKECWWFFRHKKIRPGVNPGTWVLKASTLPLDHRSRSSWYSVVKGNKSWRSSFGRVMASTPREDAGPEPHLSHPHFFVPCNVTLSSVTNDKQLLPQCYILRSLLLLF